ncbi:MutS-related protein [Solimicrobium silvestre]|uniref:MutS domain V n=1 Tax=Solimicrobium silvestre TaxID=2099400 RepID=A0A2S9GZ88_9BURK|nr:hypothetical protein [Solimicrobium silvestre]PRC93041.1 MutS domain V [Solimicrobium silvestre]
MFSFIFNFAASKSAKISRSFFPEKEPAAFPEYTFEQIAAFHQITLHNARQMDDATWRDLQVDAYLRKISASVSIFARQTLYKLLRSHQQASASLSLQKRIRELQLRPDVLEQIAAASAVLRRVPGDASSLLFSEQGSDTPYWAKAVFLIPLGLLLGFFLFTQTVFGLAVMALFFSLILALQSRFNREMVLWRSQWGAVCALMNALQRLAQPCQIHIAGCENSADVERLARLIHKQISAKPSISIETEAYGNWFLLTNIKHHFKAMQNYRLHREFIRASFVQLGEIEAAYALVLHLQSVPYTTWMEWQQAETFHFDGVVHPLLENPQAISVNLTAPGMLITGQNAGGKSTFMRTLGLNMIVARAFGFCYAKQARAPYLPVYANMQNQDDLQGGESYYIAELRRAKELLNSAQNSGRGLYLIDEIFRGTNHIESVAAASSFLHALSKLAPVVAASHNIELAVILKERFQAMRFQHGTANKYQLEEGILELSNGLCLFEREDFGEEVNQGAVNALGFLQQHCRHPDLSKLVLPTLT